MILHHLPKVVKMMMRTLAVDTLPPRDSIQAIMEVLPSFANVSWVKQSISSFRRQSSLSIRTIDQRRQ